MAEYRRSTPQGEDKAHRPYYGYAAASQATSSIVGAMACPRPVTLFCHCTNFFPSTLEAVFLDGAAQPANGGAIVNFSAGLDQEWSCFRFRGQMVGLSQSCEFRMVLECPVHIDTAAFTIFNVVLIEGSTLRTLCHMLLLLILTLLVFWHYVAPPAGGRKGPHTTSAPPPPLRDDLPSLAGSLTHYHALANFQGDTGECWCMAEHVCI